MISIRQLILKNQRGKRAHSTRVRTLGGSCYVVLNTVIAWRSRVGRIRVDSFLDCTRPDIEANNDKYLIEDRSKACLHRCRADRDPSCPRRRVHRAVFPYLSFLQLRHLWDTISLPRPCWHLFLLRRTSWRRCPSEKYMSNLPVTR